MKFNIDLDQTRQTVQGRGNSTFELLYSAGWVVMFILNIAGIVGFSVCAVLFWFLPFDWLNGAAWLALAGIWLATTAVISFLIYIAFMAAFKLTKEAATVSQPREKNGRYATLETKSAPRVATNGKFAGYMIDGQVVPPENIILPE